MFTHGEIKLQQHNCYNLYAYLENFLRRRNYQTISNKR